MYQHPQEPPTTAHSKTTLTIAAVFWVLVCICGILVVVKTPDIVKSIDHSIKATFAGKPAHS
jgi:hypothetical protein